MSLASALVPTESNELISHETPQVTIFYDVFIKTLIIIKVALLFTSVVPMILADSPTLLGPDPHRLL